MRPSVRRPPWAAIALALAAGALLAACGTTTAAVVRGPRLVGTPATSISVPLSTVGCTMNDVCVAVGTATTSVGPTMVAEFGTPHGNWINLTLPGTTSPLITSSACFAVQCLLAGSEPGSDLLWRFSAKGDTLETAPTPTGGIGVDALSCHGEACSLVDTDAAGGVYRFAFSADGGQSWSTPLPMAWATGDAVTSLACGQVAECLVAARTTTAQLIVYQTLNGGVTWSERPTPSAWTNLSSLTCSQRHCVALATTTSNSLLARTSNFGKKWTVTTLAHPANALACIDLASCVVVGRQSNDRAWLANIQDTVATDARLRYVPTPLLDVACGSKLCAAIGVTTLLSVPLPAQS